MKSLSPRNQCNFTSNRNNNWEAATVDWISCGLCWSLLSPHHGTGDLHMPSYIAYSSRNTSFLTAWPKHPHKKFLTTLHLPPTLSPCTPRKKKSCRTDPLHGTVTKYHQKLSVNLPPNEHVLLFTLTSRNPAPTAYYFTSPLARVSKALPYMFFHFDARDSLPLISPSFSFPFSLLRSRTYSLPLFLSHAHTHTH